MSKKAAKKGAYSNVGLSMEPVLFARAKERAKQVGLPFSTYVQQLIRRDIGQDHIQSNDQQKNQ